MNKRLNWKVNKENGCVEILRIDNNDIRIWGWGVETADRYSFFSQDKLGGIKVKLLDKKIEITDENINSFFVVKLKKILLKITLEDKIEESQIKRRYVLESLTDGYLSDFVTRAVFDKKLVDKANIGGRIFEFYGLNLYRQYPTNKVLLNTKLGDIELVTKTPHYYSNFNLLSYVRDEPPNKWVIHHRLLSGCNQHLLLQFYKFVLNEQFCPLLRWKKFVEKFWLYSEEKNSRLPFTFQTASYSFLSKGDKLEMLSSIIIKSNKNRIFNL